MANKSYDNVAKFESLGTTQQIKNCSHEGSRGRLNKGNACYHSVRNLLPSLFLSKNKTINTHRDVLLPVVLYGCETWYLTTKEEYRLRVFQSMGLRTIFRPEEE
jgi:hypothetical protein